MNFLDPVLPIARDECPTSYVSRLARANFIKSAHQFCRLIGLPFRGFVTGCMESFNTLSKLTAIPAHDLARNAIWSDGTSNILKGQRLLRSNIRRSQVFICPGCLKGDIATSRLPPEQAAYGRIIWRITGIHTCPEHDMALTKIANADTGTMYDFASLVSPKLNDIPKLILEAERRPASGLERYIADRLNGTTGGSAFLDNLDLFASVKTCEIFGAAALFSRKHNIKTLSPAQWRVCGAKGFDIVLAGEPSIRTFLAKMNASYVTSRVPNEGPHARFGKLYEWLAAVGEQPAYRPVRDIVRRGIIDSVPVGPPAKLFGTAIEERRVHSIRTASLQTGMHPMGLRKALECINLIGRSQRKLQDHRVLFDAREAQPILQKLEGAISLKKAENYTNAGRVHTKLLMDHGYIKPVLGDAAKRLKTLLFAPADLDDFLERILRGASPVTAPPPGMMNVAKAAKRANCSAMDIIQGILGGKLSRRARLLSERGYMALLVDLNELRQHVRKPALDGLTIQAVMTEMGTFHAVVRALIDNGKLQSYCANHPITNRAVNLIPRAELDEFNRTYVSLAELAKRQCKHPRTVRVALEQRGIVPAPELDKTIYSILFYKRAELAR
jgi:hypothetical protein